MDIRLCPAADLVVAERGRNGATGWIIQSFGVGNRSNTPCLLKGAPGVRLVGVDGRAFSEVPPDATRPDPSGLFANWAVLTPGLVDISPDHEPMLPGQAGFAFQTYGSCEHPILARYEFVVPWDPAPVVVRVDPPGPFGGGRCDEPGQKLSLSAWPFAAAVQPTPQPSPAVTPLPLSVAIEAPATVARGSVADFVVTLTSTSSAAFSLQPCPVYTITIASDEPPISTTDPESKPGYPPRPMLSYPRLVAKDTFRVLNCDATGAVLPGSSVRFAMQVQISPTAPLGSATLMWIFGPAKRNAYGEATVSVTP